MTHWLVDRGADVHVMGRLFNSAANHLQMSLDPSSANNTKLPAFLAVEAKFEQRGVHFPLPSVVDFRNMKIKAGLKFRLEADVDDYKQMLRDGWAGSMDGLVEQIEGDTVFVRLLDGQAWRFLLKNFEEVTTPHDWEGEIIWD